MHTEKIVKSGKPKARLPVRKAKKKTPAKVLREPLYIVGVGASAGGLEALRALFAAIDDSNDMAFVVAQHLAPQHKSRLVELIGICTKLKVEEARDGLVPKTGFVYVTPPNKDVLYENGVLRLKSPHLPIGPKPSIDLFFQSLAEHSGDRAIGIVLSGTGSDGALGIRAIKAAGGVTLSQKVDSAKYDGMPKAARLTGAVDLELTPQEIAKELERYKGVLRHRAREHETHESGDDPYEDILSVVEKETGANFSLYKQPTIRRRIERRVVATRNTDLSAYYNYLRNTPEEPDLLFQDILISVTSFFRDASAFRALSRHVLRQISAHPASRIYRAWIVGSATGEEAYSLAILLNETFEQLKRPARLQLFATDLDEQALAAARRGSYAKATLLDVPRTLQNKYFDQIEDRFQVKPILRDLVLFAKHNVNQDPPFLNLDLVTCRNVLIYFNSTLQESTFKKLHYSLGKNGLLFLGKSESPPATLDLFKVVDKRAKIYSRVDRKGELPFAMSRREATREARIISKERGKPIGNGHGELFASMIENFATDSVLVDEGGKIRHIFGNAGKLLNLGQGEVTLSIAKLLPPEMSVELEALFLRAGKTNHSVKGRFHDVQLEGAARTLRLVVAPLSSESGRSFLVVFENTPTESEEQPSKSKRGSLNAEEKLKRAEQELRTLREHLQTISEEQDTTNEELQSLNEELQSSNEEMQSTNEELETANEELQSSNEELTTLNQELNVKSGELQALNETLSAIQSAIIYPLLILDKNLKVLSFNPAAQFLLRMNRGDLGLHIKAIPTHVDLSQVFLAVEDVIRREKECTLQLKANDRSLEVQVQLFRGVRGVVQGAVVSFVDNTEIVSTLEETKAVKLRLSDILDNTPAIVTLKDTVGILTYANRRFCEFSGTDATAVIGKTDEEIFGADLGQAIRERDLEVVKKRKALQFEEEIRIGDRTHFWTSSKFPLFDSKHRVLSICTISLDLTERVRDQKLISHQQEELSRYNRNSALGEIAAGISHEINTPLNVITTKTDYLRKLCELKRVDEERVAKAAQEIDQMAKTISSIVLGLKTLAVSDSSVFNQCNLGTLLTDTLKVCEHRLQRHGVKLELLLPKEDVLFECSPVQISQIVINLINNAIEAIATRKGRWIQVRLTHDRKGIAIEITDSGPGVPAQLAEKIMTPFFTTKQDQNGTGIGLSLSRSIARRHGGDLALDTNAKHTTFRLSLPKAGAPK